MMEIPSSYRVHIWYEKTRMAGLQCGEGRMMIDSRLGTMHQRDRHTDSHVAIANAVLTHCVKRQKSITTKIKVPVLFGLLVI